MKTHVMMHPRVEELLVERALRPLTEAEQAELAALGGDGEDDTIERAAAAVTIAATPIEAMPDDVMARLLAQVDEVVSPGRASQPELRRTLPGVLPPAPIGAPIASLGDARQARDAKRESARRWSPAWLVAAAGLVLAVGAWWWAARSSQGPAGIAGTGSLADARAALLSSGATTIAWQTTPDAAARGASGDVVWSPGQQRGYMRFVGLAANDPSAWQYQLWIFDRTRDQAYPIDGGVFDVSSTGEVIVAISAKLHVDDAALFAVTVERPGGVVVSKRERVVVTAKPG